jgi:hypothetical protein
MTESEPMQKPSRTMTGMNVGLSIILAAATVILLNYVSIRHLHYRWDITGEDRYELSDKTVNILRDVESKVDIIVFYSDNDAGIVDIRGLTQSYIALAAQFRSLELNVDFIDPSKDLLKSKKLADDYDLSGSGVIIVKGPGKHRILKDSQIYSYDYTPMLNKQPPRRIAFNGEQLLSSAIYNVTHDITPRVYFITGHGERDVSDFNKSSGYSRLALHIERDNIDVQTLLLDDVEIIPADCSALIIAGPGKTYSKEDRAKIQTYLQNSGRAFILLDPITSSSDSTGIEELLLDWDVKVNVDVVIGKGLKEEELILRQYPKHAITENLKNTYTTFFLPRSVEPLGSNTPDDEKTHRPNVVPLAQSRENEWSETNFDEVPARFEAGKDRPGPISVAVAVEKGNPEALETEIKPTRLVVTGDSGFISNDAIRLGTHGLEFFMNALNWLLERDELIAISPRSSEAPKIVMTDDQLHQAKLYIPQVMPLAVMVFCGLIWLQRRR